MAITAALPALVGSLGLPVDSTIGKALAAFLPTVKFADGISDEAKAAIHAHLGDFAGYLHAGAMALEAAVPAAKPAIMALDAVAEGLIRIVVIGPKTGRWRAGQHFTDAPKTVDVTPDQLMVIQADKVLTTQLAPAAAVTDAALVSAKIAEPPAS